MSLYTGLALAGMAAGLLLFGCNLHRGGFALWQRIALLAAAVISFAVGVCMGNVGNWFFFSMWDLPLHVRIADAGRSWYPGMLSAILCLALLAWLTRQKVSQVLNLAAPSFPLMHAFGRVGCAFVGCCYGVPVDAQLFGLHIRRVPTQLIEAAFVCGLFLLLQFGIKRKRMEIYLLAYAAGRFILEFFRGDSRGSLFGTLLSPSQWLALLSAAAALVLLTAEYLHARSSARKAPRLHLEE